MTINRTCDHCRKCNEEEIIKEGGELIENVQVGDFILRFCKDEAIIVQLCDDCRNSLVKYIKKYIKVS